MNHILLSIIFCFGVSAFAQTGENIPVGCNNEPVLRIGLIADPQYCDCDPLDNMYFRETLWKLPQAIDTFNNNKVDLVISLGDIINQNYESYDSISKRYEKLKMPFYNLLGNHDFSEISDELKSSIVARYGMPGYYYAFSYWNWRFLVLDGTELAAYSRYTHPELAEEGDNTWQELINDTTLVSGIGLTQQAWIRSEIEDAADSGQNVILFCHFPLYQNGDWGNLWNSNEIAAILEQYPNVVAYFNGHVHRGDYVYNNNIYYFTQAAMLETSDTNSFAILNIYPKELKIQGFGRVPDKILPYTRF